MSSSTPAAQTQDPPLSSLRALLFDTFGTLTDWEGSVSRMLAEEGARLTAAGHSEFFVSCCGTMALSDEAELTRPRSLRFAWLPADE